MLEIKVNIEEMLENRKDYTESFVKSDFFNESLAKAIIEYGFEDFIEANSLSAQDLYRVIYFAFSVNYMQDINIPDVEYFDVKIYSDPKKEFTMMRNHINQNYTLEFSKYYPLAIQSIFESALNTRLLEMLSGTEKKKHEKLKELRSIESKMKKLGNISEPVIDFSSKTTTNKDWLLFLKHTELVRNKMTHFKPMNLNKETEIMLYLLKKESLIQYVDLCEKLTSTIFEMENQTVKKFKKIEQAVKAIPLSVKEEAANLGEIVGLVRGHVFNNEIVKNPKFKYFHTHVIPTLLGKNPGSYKVSFLPDENYKTEFVWINDEHAFTIYIDQIEVSDGKVSIPYEINLQPYKQTQN